MVSLERRGEMTEKSLKLNDLLTVSFFAASVSVFIGFVAAS